MRKVGIWASGLLASAIPFVFVGEPAAPIPLLLTREAQSIRVRLGFCKSLCKTQLPGTPIRKYVANLRTNIRFTPEAKSLDTIAPSAGDDPPAPEALLG